ncbi:MAG: hypothetical protein ACP5N9_05950 [Candidatus Bilamarchaeum sp.]|jgi:hypothetical protein
MKTVLLKNVPEEAWIQFRSESLSHNMKSAEFLVYLLSEHKKRKHENSNWQNILAWRSKRSKEEISTHQAKVLKNRSEFKMVR